MKVVVTGASGFVGKNLCVFLRERQHEVLEINRATSETDVLAYLQGADFVFHLAGINRPSDPRQFQEGNVDLTRFIVEILAARNSGVPLVLTSSIQAAKDNEYGASKLAAEEIIRSYSATTGAPSYIFRLPNVFGKWCRPNYNSFVATFCYNAHNGLDISVHNPKARVTLAYIDDVCSAFLEVLDGKAASGFHKVASEYYTTVGEVAETILSFKSSRETLITERVGAQLSRALYSTYLSYTPPEQFSYAIPSYADDRGVFCEMIKTKDSGQFSFFTARPGVTRGGHYHHTKNEKFLVVKGEAIFKFENISTGERHELITRASNLKIVETIPGWTHDITNSGEGELVVMLWANEIFDRQKPDTIPKKLF